MKKPPLDPACPTDTSLPSACCAVAKKLSPPTATPESVVSRPSVSKVTSAFPAKGNASFGVPSGIESVIVCKPSGNALPPVGVVNLR